MIVCQSGLHYTLFTTFICEHLNLRAQNCLLLVDAARSGTLSANLYGAILLRATGSPNTCQ
ncbi:hypothetical protein NECAME_03514 [Necator americanus]|uniref:Uncharacterized protein n=1 Tax=Necator americanus TaxID=51031 RepID=W2T5A2_NECAM|nr:hypothetical protein NECAME_03514 [Necator americanus]ETN76351.1 hypothetical protein NECAME_03514 [Necator americanus]